jgi:hypothetical protein
VRYKLPPGIHTNATYVTDRIREQVFFQLLQGNEEIALSAEITFSKVQGSRNDKTYSMDITVADSSQFHALCTFKPYLEDTDSPQGTILDVYDKGAPVSANILTVSITYLPAQTDRAAMGEALYDALNKYQPEEIEVWDIYAKHTVYEFMP